MNPENGYKVRVHTILGTVEQWQPQTVHEDTVLGMLILTFPSGSKRKYVLRNVVSYTVEAAG